MASAPDRACRCGAIVPAGERCQKCTVARQQRTDSGRGSSSERGYDARWRGARDAWLTEHPFCAECERQGKLTAAGCVDHVIPHRGDFNLFWDRANWQSLCRRCHSAKTAREDGAFGNVRRGR